MKREGNQVRNGKAVEYAIAITYRDELKKMGFSVKIDEDSPYFVAQKYFNEVEENEQKREIGGTDSVLISK